MARVNLDGKVWKDPRVKRLAKRRTWSMRETIGTLAAIWDVAYDNKTPIMRRIDVDTAAESDGFADDMIAEDLAEPIAEDLISVRLRGVHDRIEYLLRQAELGRRGGQAKAKRTASDGQANASQSPSDNVADAERTSALPPALPLSDPHGLDRDQDRKGPRARGAMSAGGSHRPALDAFHAYFQRANGGASPTWGDARIGLLKMLVKKHTSDEVIRRIGVLEASPPKWPPTPWDFDAFAKHFDKVAAPTRTGRFEPLPRDQYPEGEQQL